MRISCQMLLKIMFMMKSFTGNYFQRHAEKSRSVTDKSTAYLQITFIMTVEKCYVCRAKKVMHFSFYSLIVLGTSCHKNCIKSHIHFPIC